MLFAGRGQSASRRGLLTSHSRERLVLSIYGEVARSAGGAGGAVPPHSWGGVGAADGGADPNPYEAGYVPNSLISALASSRSLKAASAASAAAASPLIEKSR